MNDKFAKVVSYLFHPLVLSVYAVILMFFFPSWLSNYLYIYKKTIFLIVLLITLIIPTLILLILLNLKIIKSLSLTERKERLIPYIVITALYTLGYFVLINTPLLVPSKISGFILIADIIIVLLMLLNFFFKISAHMAGMGGFLSFFYTFMITDVYNNTLFFVFGIPFSIVTFLIALVIIAGLVAGARMQLKDHNPFQIVTGFLLGVVIGFFGIWV